MPATGSSRRLEVSLMPSITTLLLSSATARHSSRMTSFMDVTEIAARAAGENFPVGSILFPRQLRRHVRALYCYARLVDELGDAYDGDRLSALDELELQGVLTFAGGPPPPPPGD